MATAPRRGRGSGEGASLTASVAALLRVPGGAEVPWEVRGFGVRERTWVHTDAVTGTTSSGTGTPGQYTQDVNGTTVNTRQAKEMSDTLTHEKWPIKRKSGETHIYELAPADVRVPVLRSQAIS
jgi:hypothetical protein